MRLSTGVKQDSFSLVRGSILKGSRSKSVEQVKEGEMWIRNGSFTLIVFNLIRLLVAIATVIIPDHPASP